MNTNSSKNACEKERILKRDYFVVERTARVINRKPTTNEKRSKKKRQKEQTAFKRGTMSSLVLMFKRLICYICTKNSDNDDNEVQMSNVHVDDKPKRGEESKEQIS